VQKSIVKNKDTLYLYMYVKEFRHTRDRVRQSIIRLGVKIDNGLDKLNQDLKKAEKVKSSDQTSGSTLRARYTLTTARGAR
jgi:hypothetical protein